jgi:hypothetical protein
MFGNYKKLLQICTWITVSETFGIKLGVNCVTPWGVAVSTVLINIQDSNILR